jgi:hypothetical protein
MFFQINIERTRRNHGFSGLFPGLEHRRPVPVEPAMASLTAASLKKNGPAPSGSGFWSRTAPAGTPPPGRT